MKCRKHIWSCVYHACMSDDCQKRHVLANGIDWGEGECQINTINKINKHGKSGIETKNSPATLQPGQ